MKSQTYLITVSFDEFTCLHDSGQLRVDWNRLTPGSASRPSPDVVTSLIMRLPEFMERDEHNLVVLLFEVCHGMGKCSQSPIVRPDFRHTLMAEDCRQVIPLTTHAKSILESRFSGRVVLGDPVFEQAFEEDFRLRHLERSMGGADALVRSIVDAEGYSVPSQLQKLALRSGNSGGLLDKVLNYQRKDPMPREPISGLRDLGRVLTETLPDRKPTEQLMQLRDWLKPRCETVVGFRLVYMDPVLEQILEVLTDHFSLPTHAAALGLFFHWRELALRVGGLDLVALEADCRELSGCVPGGQIVDSIWLLGFSAGFETFASAYYSRLDKAHPFGGGRTIGEKVRLLWPKALIQGSTASESKVVPQPAEIQQPAVQTIVEGNDPAGQSSDQSPTQMEAVITKTDEDVHPVAGQSNPPGPAIKAARKTAKKAASSKGGRTIKDSSAAQDGELFNQ